MTDKSKYTITEEMKVLLSSLGCLFVLTGCAAVSNLEEITRLQNFSNQQEATDDFVEETDEKFFALVVAVENQTIDQYPDQTAILEEFSEPIYKKTITRNGQEYEEWLYRRSVYFFNSSQVLLTFDKAGHLVKHVYKPVDP